MFFNRNLLLISIIVMFFSIVSGFYYFLNKPSINYNKINNYKNQLKGFQQEKIELENKLKINKRRYQSFQKLIYTDKEEQKLLQIINLLNTLMSDTYHCIYYGITNNKKYINVINVYYQCNTKRDALLMSKIVGFFLQELKLPVIKIQFDEPDYVKINFFKKVRNNNAK